MAPSEVSLDSAPGAFQISCSSAVTDVLSLSIPDSAIMAQIPLVGIPYKT